MKTRGYFYCGLTTTLKIILYVLTFGNFLWLEGRVCHGYFRNWLRRFGYRPRHFELPETEEEIVNLIKNSPGNLPTSLRGGCFGVIKGQSHDKPMTLRIAHCLKCAR